MPLAMNREVFITCAVTGSGGTQDRSPHVPPDPVTAQVMKTSRVMASGMSSLPG